MKVILKDYIFRKLILTLLRRKKIETMYLKFISLSMLVSLVLMSFKCEKSHPDIEFVNKSSEDLIIDSISDQNLWSESIDVEIKKNSSFHYMFKNPYSELSSNQVYNVSVYFHSSQNSYILPISDDKINSFKTKKLIFK